MIILTDVANELQNILNGENNPIDFQFVVKAQGYTLDSIIDRKTGKNTIPVFIAQVGGNFNAVPTLKQNSFDYEITMYFPVRFKNDFYTLNSFIEDTFVGKQKLYGTHNALSNISVAQYGEINGIELEKFVEWTEENYGEDLKLYRDQRDITEPYMSMTFHLYLSTLNSGFLFGNDISYYLTMQIKRYEINSINNYSRYVAGDTTGYYAWKNSDDEIIYTTIEPTLANYIYYISHNVKFYEVEDSEYVLIDFEIVSLGKTTNNLTHTITTELVYTNGGTGGSITPISQQLIGNDLFIKNIANITSYNKALLVFPRFDANNEFWQYFTTFYGNQELNEIISLKLKKVYANGINFTYNQITLSLNENIQLGSPLSYTLTFGDK